MMEQPVHTTRSIRRYEHANYELLLAPIVK
jgi:hypothetical protein